MSTRVLVKDGAWQVPPEERPKGWKQLPMREPAAAPLNIVVTVSGVPDILRCGCGRSLHHRGQCHVRRVLAQLQLDRKAAHFQTILASVITESGRWFGADKTVLNTALVMVAGLYTRHVYELARLTGIRPHLVKEISVRLAKAGIWNPDGSVVLGDLNPQYEDFEDLEFWLIAMAGAGEIRMVQPANRSLKFGGISTRKQA